MAILIAGRTGAPLHTAKHEPHARSAAAIPA